MNAHPDDLANCNPTGWHHSQVGDFHCWARMPGDAEAAAAVRGMREIYRSDYRPSPGDKVLVERPFYGDIVHAIVVEMRGDLVTVDVHGEQLGYTVDEVTPAN